MRIDILTGLPRLLDSPFQESILKRAQVKGLVTLHVHDIRDYAHDKHQTIDDTPYGGGSGMVLKPEPIFECVDALRAQRTYDETVLMTADGVPFNQRTANELSLRENLLIICGHYKGVDERVRRALVTKEISIGDFVLTGGELAAAVVVDAVVRLIPGVLNDGESALSDSFQDGLLGSPEYTRPPEYRGMKVPDELLSGDHKLIQEWRDRQRTERTRSRRNDLLNS
ncbi:MAG: tRNA (guanosine(37)-N1)-methyltransferase TrmD [Ignavibacteria bacterium RIFCSPLOWO2_02_FULL_55_14]|nr:MAG: tRNA (guanosine(37)-N1)-methyltransferase TrmD [Ignavibacteria bacterium GWC2_56_12]OGU74018.1 MAG: tRNA (guanosine(37)-N1)-methyltransferase TrmD [Ignavibacteria bacterium RIFCSPLOWO2_02_FULL_55_14]